MESKDAIDGCKFSVLKDAKEAEDHDNSGFGMSDSQPATQPYDGEMVLDDNEDSDANEDEDNVSHSRL